MPIIFYLREKFKKNFCYIILKSINYLLCTYKYNNKKNTYLISNIK